DATFYGTAKYGGIESFSGTLFKMAADGTLSVLFDFCGKTSCKLSQQPSSLIQATNGMFYGTTWGGGNGKVVIFGFPPYVNTSPTSGAVGSTVTIYGSDLSGTTAVTFNTTPATFTIVSPTEITASVPAGATFGTVKVTTPSGTLLSDITFRV